MKKIIILTFDLIQKGEPKTSLSAGYLISYLNGHDQLKKNYSVDHISFNLRDRPAINVKSILGRVTDKYNITTYDYICISCYIWSDHLTNPLIKALRAIGYENKIILGGNQISGVKNLPFLYPDCQIFIVGYGEEALAEAILSKESIFPVTINKPPNISLLPSPYLSKTIPVVNGQEKVRIETK